MFNRSQTQGKDAIQASQQTGDKLDTLRVSQSDKKIATIAEAPEGQSEQASVQENVAQSDYDAKSQGSHVYMSQNSDGSLLSIAKGLKDTDGYKNKQGRAPVTTKRLARAIQRLPIMDRVSTQI